MLVIAVIDSFSSRRNFIINSRTVTARGTICPGGKRGDLPPEAHRFIVSLSAGIVTKYAIGP